MSEASWPSLKVITRFLRRFTILSSWVAMIMVFPARLSSRSTLIISVALFGSRSPVGSSQMIIAGSWIRARAIATRCASHPESVLIKASFLWRSHTCVRTSGTRLMIWLSRYPQTSMAKATFSRTVLFLRSL